MASLAYSSVFENGWRNIFDLIKLVSDPKSRGKKWVYGAFPDSRFNDKSAYPILVIHPVNMSGYDVLTMGTSPQKEVTIPIQIDIFSLQAQYIHSITDDIFKKLEDSEATLFTNKMTNLGVLRSSYSNFIRGGMKVHMKSIVYGFKFNFSV